MALYLLLACIPNSIFHQIIAVKFAIYLLSWIINLDHATWDDKLLSGMDFMSKSVLQVPFLMMTLMRYVTPTLDEM